MPHSYTQLHYLYTITHRCRGRHMVKGQDEPAPGEWILLIPAATSTGSSLLPHAGAA